MLVAVKTHCGLRDQAGDPVRRRALGAADGAARASRLETRRCLSALCLALLAARRSKMQTQLSTRRVWKPPQSSSLVQVQAVWPSRHNLHLVPFILSFAAAALRSFVSMRSAPDPPYLRRVGADKVSQRHYSADNLLQSLLFLPFLLHLLLPLLPLNLRQGGA